MDKPVGQIQLSAQRMRQGVIELMHAGREQALRIERAPDQEALASLRTRIEGLKAAHPERLEATVLVEPQVSYDLVVQVLDALRV